MVGVVVRVVVVATGKGGSWGSFNVEEPWIKLTGAGTGLEDMGIAWVVQADQMRESTIFVCLVSC